MTLSEAYKGWGEMVQNAELYHKTRKAFYDTWATLDKHHPCSYYTEERLGEALCQTRVVESSKKAACRTIIAALDWASFFEDSNPEPHFTVDTLMAYTRPQEVIIPVAHEEKKPEQAKPSSTSPVLDMEEVLKVIPHRLVTNSIKTTEMKGIKKKPVYQLDPVTLEIAEKHDSVSDARRKLGTVNINRALTDVTKAGGFFWCYPEDYNEMVMKIRDKWFENGKPKAPKPGPKKANVAIVKHTEPVTKTASTCFMELSDFSDEELFAELKARGFKGTLTKTFEL